jgi:hypothetical protein
MNISVADGELAVLESQSLSQYEAGARSVAQRQGKGFFAALGGALLTIVDFPARHAALVKLVGLSDQQLADRGLARADLARVFDADFDPNAAIAGQIKR